MSYDKVAILLATYNGENFLCDQLESLLCQTHEKLVLFVRDDGSTDNTQAILSRFAGQDNRVQCRFEDNVGVISSFFDLVKTSGDSFDYYSFCDQDDVWQQNKISSAIKQMEATDPEIPLLYFSGVEYVDDKLRHLGYSVIPKRITFEHALVENLATGCTIVVNRSARNLILSCLPEFALMHDWWMFLVVSAFGKIIYDPDPKILYRQHSTNVVGGTTDRFKANLKKIIPFFKSVFDPTKMRTSDQVREFKRLYGERLDARQIRYIDEFLDAKSSIIQRLRLVAIGKYRRQNIVDNWVFSILITLGYY